jgi:5'-nucleotidase
MSFKSVFQDIRNAVDYVHMKVKLIDVVPQRVVADTFSFSQGDLKKRTIENMPKYLVRDENLPILLKRMQVERIHQTRVPKTLSSPIDNFLCISNIFT